MSPAEQRLSLLNDQFFNGLFHNLPLDRIDWQEDQSHAVLPQPRKCDVQLAFCHLGQEVMRDGRQNPGSVTCVGLASAGPSMRHVFQHPQRIINDLPRFLTLDVCHKTNAAGVVFVGGVIQSLSLRSPICVKQIRIAGGLVFSVSRFGHVSCLIHLGCDEFFIALFMESTCRSAIMGSAVATAHRLIGRDGSSLRLRSRTRVVCELSVVPVFQADFDDTWQLVGSQRQNG